MPQVFVHGELIGGSDIALEMLQDGSLREMFDAGRQAEAVRAKNKATSRLVEPMADLLLAVSIHGTLSMRPRQGTSPNCSSNGA